MGTRHLTCVVKDNEFRVAQYGQWDGYPSGQGVNIVTFIKEVLIDDDIKRRAFEKHLDLCVEIGEEEMDERLELRGIKTENGWMDMHQAEIYKVEFPHMSRDIGSDILWNVLGEPTLFQGEYRPKMHNGKIEIHLMPEFAFDGLFCEYAYVVDLDRDELFVYSGFNKGDTTCNPHHFMNLVPTKDRPEQTNEYDVVGFVARYPFKHLKLTDPDLWARALESTLDPEEEVA